MSSPLASIIIPCWNGEHIVAQAIDSALAQTYRHVEVIVIDDGSTDGTPNVLRSFGDRIRWESTPNRGACAARNRGAELAAGDFLQFLDADDLLFPRKIERSVEAATETDSMPICGWETTIEGGPPHLSLPETLHRDPLDYALTTQIPTPSPLHRRQWFWQVGGFMVGLPCSQERDLHIRLIASGLKITPIAEPLVHVRKRAGSVSSDFHRVLLQHEGVFLRARDILQRRGALSDARRAALARAFVRDARLLVRRNDYAAALRYAARARAMHSQGGLDAFTRRHSRALAQIIGPVFAETVIFQARWVARACTSVSPGTGSGQSRSGA